MGGYANVAFGPILAGAWEQSAMKRKYPTLEQVEDMDANSQGFCTACGEIQDGCEPDARNYVCESCNLPEVYGAGELAIEGWVK